MNERIKELALQAGVYEGVFTKHDGVPCDLKGYGMLPDEMAKFAELIVQDCVSKLAWVPQSSGPEGLGEYNQGWVNGRALAVEHIKEHFGVK